MKPAWLPIAVVALLAVVALFSLHRVNPDALEASNNVARLIYLLILALLIGSGVLFARRHRPRFSYLLIWLAIGAALVLGYGLRHEFAAVLLPHRDSAGTEGVARFEANVRGEFRVEAVVDGVPLRFLVDTGASDVTLTPADARRLGLDPGTLDYTRIYTTASGQVRGAPVRLGEVALGGIRMRNVGASVNSVDMPVSLLGMSFLGRLSGFEVRDGVLTLYE